MPRILISVALLFFITKIASAQPQNYNWYFGNQGALNFSPGAPVAVSGSNMNAFESCSSISDDNGYLLFYTNGDSIWDKTNSLMTGGYMTEGASSTQTLVIRKPGSFNLYYVFHTSDHMSTGDFRYSIVDVCLNNGLGDIASNANNVLVEGNCEEKICAVKHSNDSDYWIIVHTRASNEFHAYQLSASGLNLTPVISSVGATHSTGCMIGPMKSNHAGNKVINFCTFCYIGEMFDFDNSTGTLSNGVDVDALIGPNTRGYGVEFSPDDQLLYVATTFNSNYLYQIDLSNNNVVQLANAYGVYVFGALQLAPDGKIYMARGYENYIDVISDPDVVGAGCNYQSHAVTLSPGATCRFGLPNALSEEMLPPIIQNSISDSGYCTSYFFKSSLFPGFDSVVWNFDDTMSGNANTSGDTNAIHDFTQLGTYHVQLVVYFSCFADTVIDTVNVGMNPVIVNLGNDTTICTGQSFTLDAANNGAQYQWSTGDTSQSITVTTPDLYWVIVRNSCDTLSDSVVVNFQVPPSLGVFPDTTICFGDTIQLFAANGFQNYQWLPDFHLSCDTCQNPLSNPDANVNYIVTATFGVCTVSDTIHITLINSLINVTPDTSILCLGDSVQLHVNTGDAFLWSPSSGLSCSTCQSPEATPGITTSYMVTVTFASCIRRDTVQVDVVTPPPFDLKDDTLCAGDILQLFAPVGFDSYQWQPSAGLSCDTCSDPYANPDVTTTYHLTVTESPCAVTDDVTVIVDQNNLSASNDTTILLGTGVQLFASGAFIYSWSPSSYLNDANSATPFAIPPVTITYTVSATSQYGCKSEANVTVIVYDPCSYIAFPSAFTPNDDGINDFFHPTNNTFLSNYHLKIFNRWGQLLFETNDPLAKWDGKYNGLDCELGVYVYVMTGNCAERKLELKGNVTLVR